MTQPYDPQPEPGQPSEEWGPPVYSGQAYSGPPQSVYPGPPISHVTDEPWQPMGEPAVYQLGYPPAPGPTPRRKLPWILGSVVAALLLLVGGGGLVAYQALNGGGTQPDQVIPGNAVAFVKLDLNPSASQKIAAARFLNRIPKVGAGFSSSGDWRRPLFDSLASNDVLPSPVSFDRDIKPWLGKRMAVAVLPGLTDGAPQTLFAVQSTDDTKARAGLARFGGSFGISFRKGYAVLGESQQITDQAVAQAASSSLASSAQYRADLAQVGSLGIASGWADLAGLSKLVGYLSTNQLNTGLPASGRLAFTVRFSSSTADLVIKAFGQQATESAGAPLSIGDLPASTAVAVQASGLDHQVDRTWVQFKKELGQFSDPDGDDLLQQLDDWGISMPGDLDTLLGSNLLLAVDSKNLTGETPEVGIRTRTNGPAAVAVLDRLRTHLGGDFPLHYRATADGVVAATDEQYLDTMLAPAGNRLSRVAGFGSAVPELKRASVAAFVNLDAISAELRAHGADVRQLSEFRAVGLTVVNTGSVGTMHLRLVAH